MKFSAPIANLVAILVVLAAIITATLTLLPDDEAARFAERAAGRSPEWFPPLRVGQMEPLIVHETPRDEMTATFLDSDDNPVTVADFKGKVLMINLWATWCAPCRVEMPSIDRLAREINGEDFHVIAVSLDRGSRERVDAFLEEIEVQTLTAYRNPNGNLAQEAGIFGLPTTLIIGRDGREVARLIGDAEWDGPEARAVLNHFANTGDN